MVYTPPSMPFINRTDPNGAGTGQALGADTLNAVVAALVDHDGRLNAALPSTLDPVQRRNLHLARVAADWISTVPGAQLYLGEIGWPRIRGQYTAQDAAGWNSVGEQVLNFLDTIGAHWSYWTVGSIYGDNDYMINPYTSVGAFPSSNPVSTGREQAPVLERHFHRVPGRYRGVVVTGLERFGANHGVTSISSFSNTNIGVYGTDYLADNADSAAYLYSRGARLARIMFRWERIQPTLNGALNATEWERVASLVAAYRNAGFTVALCPWNFGGYWIDNGSGTGVKNYIGTGAVPTSAYLDLWARISSVYKGDSNIVYNLMNEPVGMPGATSLAQAQNWQTISQSAVNAIRANGDSNRIAVPTYQWSGVDQLMSLHPGGPWIYDTAGVGKIWYDVHHYFDADRSGAYSLTYDQEIAQATAGGYA